MSKYFYIDRFAIKKGPFSFEELKNEEINSETLIWYQGLENWTPANKIKKFEIILELIPPPIKFNDDNSNIEETSENGTFEKVSAKAKIYADKSFLKNIPFLLIVSIIAGLIGHSTLLYQANFAKGVGIMISTLVMLTGIPLLIVRIVKWFSKNRQWDENATISTWILQLMITFFFLYGSYLR